MKKAKAAPNKDPDALTRLVTVRVTPRDVEQLEATTKQHPLAKKGAVAREALRRGLAALHAERP